MSGDSVLLEMEEKLNQATGKLFKSCVDTCVGLLRIKMFHTKENITKLSLFDYNQNYLI